MGHAFEGGNLKHSSVWVLSRRVRTKRAGYRSFQPWPPIPGFWIYFQHQAATVGGRGVREVKVGRWRALERHGRLTLRDALAKRSASICHLRSPLL